MEHLLSREQLDYRDYIRDYLARRLTPIADDLEKKREFPLEFYRQSGRDGLLGVNVPVKFGGKGLDSVSSALLLEEVAKISTGVALSIFTSMVPSLIILSVGSQEQKGKYLEGIAKGEYIVTFCLSEPNAGSYNLGMETTAVLDNGSYVINGNKTFITNGSVANLHVVVAYTDRTKGAKGISMFVVEGNTPGIHVSRKMEKLGWDSSDTAEMTFSDVRIPRQNLLGKEGAGLLQALDGLNFGRAALGAISLGLAESIFDLCRTYVTGGNPLGQPLSRYQHFRHRLARMSIELEASALLVWSTMKKRDLGLKYMKDASSCKVFCGHVARNMALEAMKFFGAEAFVDYYAKVSRCFRDAPAHTIADGTQEMQLEVISREIGLGKQSM